MIEIRNYHYRPDLFEAYREWAINDAVPFLKEALDVVGFWISNGEAEELTGSDPKEHPHGAANVTWIIRWDSKAARDKAFAEVFGGEGWQAVWDKHPDQNGYLQMQAKFMEEL